MKGKLTLAEATKAILRGCSQWTINSINHLGEGDFCSAYVVNYEWVFRFAKHEKARESLMRECCLLPRLANQIALQIPSPQIVSLEEDAEQPFIAYPFLPGPSLSQERYLSLNDASRDRCAEQVAHFLRQVHSVNTSLAQA
ncbi:MAG TPA: phosphotransferase, partial [Blastocatellia bacterium]